MRFLGFGKASPKKERPEVKPAACVHPVAYQVILHDDPSDRLKTTGVKCTRCGESLPLPKAA